MRPSLATVADLERLLGRNVDDEDQSLAQLEQASALVRAYARRTWVDDDGELADVPDDIPGVVIDIVSRSIANADGAVSETLGPYSRSFGNDASQRLYLTSANKMVIRAAIGATTNGIGTLSTSRGSLETPSAIIDGDEFSDEPYTGS